MAGRLGLEMFAAAAAAVELSVAVVVGAGVVVAAAAVDSQRASETVGTVHWPAVVINKN